ncbi:MAG TPA: dehydrogenase E1 component subunit alpha/beta [Pirellulaceae bacterium]|nr:dehydrogenase E1 component subunit alpha/beta [Pirellulaceae bacterium]
MTSATKPAAIDRELGAALYRTMRRIRATEEELARCHQRGLIHGACHTYVGQEAVATGVVSLLTAADPVFSTHRGHGHALAKGMPPRELMAELFGRVGGCSRGRGGSMHLFAPEIGMMGTSGIVGPCILQACGGGYSSKLLGNGTVSVAFFGDGAVNNGAFHEGLNMASIWKLPVLFVCENNGFATEVPFDYASGQPSVAARAAGYGMVGVEVDGNDVLAVRAAAAEAVARAKRGEGPTLIECRTYRTRAHAEGMGDFTYRTRDEVEAWKERCPIARLRAVLEQDGLPPERIDAIDAEIDRETAEARRWAEASPWPEASTATLDVYGPPLEPESPAAKSLAVTADEVTATPRSLTWAQATLEALTHAMSSDGTIFVLGEGIGKRGGNFQTTLGLYEQHGPVRLCDTPICERGFVGLACGAAMTGTRPIVDFMFADFVLDGVGEIVNQIAKMRFMSSGRLRMPVLLRGCIGIGHSAATHHSGSYYGMYAQVPGLRVVVPSTAVDARGLLKHALRCEDPVLFLEHRELLQLRSEIVDDDEEIPFGRARIARLGKDVTIVALARMVRLSEEAAAKLASEGIEVEVIDPRTVLPLDVETIRASVAKTGRLLVVDEPPASCGFAAEIAARMADEAFDDLDAPIRRLTGAFAPTPYSPSLEAAVVPSADAIAAAVRTLIAE